MTCSDPDAKPPQRRRRQKPDPWLIRQLARWLHRRGHQRGLDVWRPQIHVPDWPADRPLTIGFASDFHSGPLTDPLLLTEACQALREAAPDLILLGGDFVSFHARQIQPLLPALAKLKAPLGCFAVLGNHDIWADGCPSVRAYLHQIDLPILENRHLRLPAPFDPITLVGLADACSQIVLPDQAMAGSTSHRLILTHSPDAIAAMAGYQFDVMFCGHTHGGQINLTQRRPLRYAQGNLTQHFYRGRYDPPATNNGTLLIGNGLGFSGLPWRWGAPSQIIIATLGPDR